MMVRDIQFKTKPGTERKTTDTNKRAEKHTKKRNKYTETETGILGDTQKRLYRQTDIHKYTETDI